MNRRGRTYGTTDLLLQYERVVLNYAKELGLTPRSAADLGHALAGTQVDLARLWSMGGKAPTPAGAGVARER